MKTILITSIGKRVKLVQHFNRRFNTIGVDCSDLAPAGRFVNEFFIVQPFEHKAYIESIVEICKEYKVDGVIPLHEKEFGKLDLIRNQLLNMGTKLILPSKAVLDICSDKWLTMNILKQKGFKVPNSSLNISELNGYPLFIKPRNGMGSFNAYLINDEEELNFYYKKITKPIIQQYIKGTEYTVDCLSDLNGKVIAAVPRERLEVRAGEVIKSKTVLDMEMIKEAIAICEHLQLVGPSTLQCIKDQNGDNYWLEINTRFGGGVPLTFEAGVDYGFFIEQMLEGKDIEPITFKFKELTMLRYDEAVFV